MKVIVGLGNPGSEYEATRHNAGFMVVDALAKAHGVSLKRRLVLGRRLLAQWGEWRSESGARPGESERRAGEVVRLLLPQTLMNLSGEAVRAASSWLSAPHGLLIVCDDVNLPLGHVRMRPKGSAGGQHGLASCLAALGTDEVPRLRIGIGSEPLPKDLTEYVLSTFRPSERPAFRQTLSQAVEACELWVAEGIDAAMNQVND